MKTSKKKNYLRKYFLFLIYSFCVSINVSAGEIESGNSEKNMHEEVAVIKKEPIEENLVRGPIFRRLAGPYLSICMPESKICKRVKMPKSLGRVEEVFPGPFLERVDASWVALSSTESFLCSVPEATQKVICVRILADKFPIEHAQLRVGIHGDGKASTFVLPRSTTVDVKKLKAISFKYNKAVDRATQVLQGETDGLGMRSFDFAATTSVCDDEDPGPAPAPGCVRQGNEWLCPEIDVHADPWPWPDIPFPVPFPDFPGDEPPPFDGNLPICYD